jgi:hypothetical protein
MAKVRCMAQISRVSSMLQYVKDELEHLLGAKLTWPFRNLLAKKKKKKKLTAPARLDDRVKGLGSTK